MNFPVVIIDLRQPPIRARKMNGRKRAYLRGLLIRAQDGICAHCEKPLPAEWEHRSPDEPTLDHVQARSLGGSNDISNLLVKHRECNEAGGNRPPSKRDRKWQAIVAARLGLEAA